MERHEWYAAMQTDPADLVVTLTTMQGDDIVLHHVQCLDIIDPHTVSVQCFGNDLVIRRNIRKFTVSPFTFSE